LDRAARTFGTELRRWRAQRGLTQMALALAAEVSTRHLSWLEGGKAEPSRAMVLRLCEHLNVPLRERNALLVTAGFAPLYAQRSLDAPESAHTRAALQRLLDAYEPWPALAVDSHWRLVAHNRMLPLLMQALAPAALSVPLNVLRLSLHPQGLAPRIVDFPRWRAHVLARLQRQVAASGDPMLVRLREELQALPMPAHAGGEPVPDASDDLAFTLKLRTPWGVMGFVTTVTVFGAPHDVALSELAVETLLPADADTAARLRSLFEASF
jgi:transcriptional regulator with XRE-family HTH domain